MTARAVSLVIGYIFGLIQTGFIIGKIKGIDIRDHGSGNTGSTNALRTMGKKVGITVLLIDMAKCIISCLISYWIFGDEAELHGGSNMLYMLYSGLGCAIGHNFPFYMHFKGGKGIAVTGGLIIILSPTLTWIGILVFVGVIVMTKYVSLGSICVSLEFLTGWLILGLTGSLALKPELFAESCVLVFIICAMAIIRHKENIKRLIKGKESALFGKKKVQNG